MPQTGIADAALLRIENLQFGVDGAPLCAPFTQDLHAGELVGIAGPSGCGKSTLFRAIALLDQPLGGRVLFRGEDPAALGWTAFRRRVVLVSQREVLLDRSVRGNLERVFSYTVAGEKFPAPQAVTLLHRVGLPAEALEQNARTLSGGEQQRICLVRALLTRPEVLLLDEPTSALDEATADAVEALIRDEARSRGLAALIVTHERARAERWCDRVIPLCPTAVPAAPGGPPA